MSKYIESSYFVFGADPIYPSSSGEEAARWRWGMWDRHSTTSDAYEIWMVFRVTRKPPLTSVRFYSGFRALLNFLFCCAQAIPKLILQVDIPPYRRRALLGGLLWSISIHRVFEQQVRSRARSTAGACTAVVVVVVVAIACCCCCCC